MKFSTLDQDNDESDGNCAPKCSTAGWLNDCFWANLNGPYIYFEKTGLPEFISWNQWKNYDISLKSIQLMIRPRA